VIGSRNRADPGRSLLKTLAPEITAERKKALKAFLKTTRIRFKSLDLLNLSFIHRSVSNEALYKVNNERLEFLGDAVLGAATAALLYDHIRDKPEGDLAKIKAVVVSEEILSGIARRLGLDALLVLGKGEEMTGGRNKKALLADALEALTGALYLDGGYHAAFSFIEGLISPEIEEILQNRRPRDYKSWLQEYCQGRFKSCPVYNLLGRSGPEHGESFWTEVGINGRILGQGMGRSKKSAEQDAARAAFEVFNAEETPDALT
jgi:ribonuclease-3